MLVLSIGIPDPRTLEVQPRRETRFGGLGIIVGSSVSDALNKSRVMDNPLVSSDV